MKVTLINSPRLFFKNKLYSYTTPPLGIAYINGYLNEKGIKTDLIDLEIVLTENQRLFKLLKSINQELKTEEFIVKYQKVIDLILNYFLSRINLGNTDIIGISVLEAQSLKIILPLAEKIKERYPSIKIIMGGNSVYLANRWKNYIIDRVIDFLVFKEGEKSFFLLIKAIRNKTGFSKIPSIVYLNKGRVVFSKEDLKFDFSIQRIKFNKTQVDEYRFRNHFYETFNDLFIIPTLPYHFSRGCSFQCTFCGAALDRIKQKHKNFSQIVKEIREMKKRYKYKYFFFYNMHLNFTKTFVEELCDHIIDSKLDILWSDSIKPLPYMTQKIYHKMREAGCIELSYGIETGSKRIMELMNKGHSVSDNEKNLRYAHKAGIWNMTNFLVGFPGESEKEFDDTLKFIKKNYDYIDCLLESKFRLIDNYIRANPDKYGIKIRSKGELNNPINEVLSEYDEIGGLSYEELLKVHQQRCDKLFRMVHLEDKYKSDFFVHRMIFPLYDQLITKNKVRNFLRENYDIIKRSNNSFYSLFTGTLSNQKIKGNLHQSSIDEFKFVPYERLVKRIEEIYNDGYKKLIIVGGEPLIRKDIFKVLSAAKNIGFGYIIVKTNARILKYKEFCKKLSRYVDEILVINPSDGEKEYESISGVRGSFSQTEEGISNWKMLNKKVR